MNRRGHLSSKIPNVKLRPSRADSARRRKEPSPMNAMDEEVLRRAWAGAEDEETSSTALRSSSRPWEGVVITFTGIENKAALTKMAKELGASVEAALTVAVTHVVAVGFVSQKYLYAVEHRLCILKPDWITDAHAAWLAGGEFTLRETIAGHELLPFTGLTIAMSGIEPLERRKQLVRAITDNGGSYSKDLDRDCTHLVSAKPTNDRNPSEKVKWATRELALRASSRRQGKVVDGDDMCVVYEEWIWDCVGYGGRWKEDRYDARKVRRTGKCAAMDVISGAIKRPGLAEPSEQTEDLLPGAEEAPAGPAMLRKRKRDAWDGLVGELISTAAPAKVEVRPSRADGEMDIDAESAQRLQADAPTGRRTVSGANDGQRKSLLHASRTDSFTAPARADPPPVIPLIDLPNAATSSPDTSAPMRFEQANASAAAGPSRLTGPGRPAAPIRAPGANLHANPDADASSNAGPAPSPRKYAQIFTEIKLTPMMAESALLERALRVHGGVIVREDAWREGQKTDYLVVRLGSGKRPDLSDIPEDERPTVVTECWVEGCCFEERLLPLDKDMVFTPLAIPLPVPGADRVGVHMSGFPPEKVVYLKRLIKVLGMTLKLRLNRHSTHLVIKAPKAPKFPKAEGWGVERVTEEWLYAIARSGRMEAEDGFRHSESAIAAMRDELAQEGAAASASGMASTAQVSLAVPLAPASASGSAAAPLSPARQLKAAPTPVDAQVAGTGYNEEMAGGATGPDKENVGASGGAGTGMGMGMGMERGTSSKGASQLSKTGSMGATATATVKAEKAEAVLGAAKGPGDVVEADGDVDAGPALVTASHPSHPSQDKQGSNSVAVQESHSTTAVVAGRSAVASAARPAPPDRLKESAETKISRTASAPSESLVEKAKRASASSSIPAASSVGRTASAGVPAAHLKSSAAAPTTPAPAAGSALASALGRDMNEVLRLLVDAGPTGAADRSGSVSPANAGTGTGAGATTPMGAQNGVGGDANTSTSASTSTSGSRVIRRGRPSHRVRPNASAATPSTPNLNPFAVKASHRAALPLGDVSVGDTTADTTALFTPSPSKTAGRDGRGEADGDGNRDGSPEPMSVGRGAGGMGPPSRYAGAGYADESIRVDYVDPAAERERKRILDAYRRAEKQAAAAARSKERKEGREGKESQEESVGRGKKARVR